MIASPAEMLLLRFPFCAFSPDSNVCSQVALVFLG